MHTRCDRFRPANTERKRFYAAAIVVIHPDSVMKNLLLLLLVSFSTASCSDESSLKVSGRGDHDEIISISFDDFKSNPEDYYGKQVKLVGMCVRVEKRGGSAMYMIGKDPSFEIKVAASDDVVRFTRYFEGRLMEVRGTVRHEDTIHRLTRNQESAKEYGAIPTSGKPDYYIECNQYRRVQNKGSSSDTEGGR